MPKFLEDRLKAEAEKKRYSGKRADSYVYGTMQNIGAIKGNKETAKGRAMDAKHEADKKRKKKGSASHAGDALASRFVKD
jgi:hypothetical protein